ncbi:MAG: B12-binding domain-containing radical SAM protein [Magnetococcales bacterium]|nr:B12-binding domain-containing radical SAM protein [Magnetococcales bacterium]MBF0322233.1 B12-binding domain-containing radical SAM protein [Magnetococcales bacterium]
MRVVLLTTPTRTSLPNSAIPHGIIALAAYLETMGHEPCVIDAALERSDLAALSKKVADCSPGLIGVGGIITAYAYVITLTKELKKWLPHVPIVLGGPIAIHNEENCFKHMVIDYIINGYGEIPLEKLLRSLSGQLSLDAIPGLTWLKEGTLTRNPGREFFRDLDAMPLPGYRFIDMEHYTTVNGTNEVLEKYLRLTGKKVKSHRSSSINGMLGCTDKCTFCVHEQEFVGLKAFSLDYVVNHIRHVHETYGVHVVSIGEEMFLTNLGRAKKFNEMMMEQLPDVYWMASTRANHVSEALVQELRKGNCFHVQWGFESGSQKILDLMQKRISREQNIQALKNLRTSPIGAVCSLMIGNIGESPETIKETRRSIHEAGITDAPIFYATPYPGGRTWDWVVERGIIGDTHAYLSKISDKDAGELTCNMTPYPDWVLRVWKFQLRLEILIQTGIQREIHNGDLPARLKKYIKLYFSPILLILLDVFLLIFGYPLKIIKMVKFSGHRGKIDTDTKGVILPKNLRLGKPPKLLSSADLIKK